MIDPRVLEEMLPYMKDIFGNAASTEHEYGWKSNDAVNISREKISNLINCSPNEVIFTSGATEANNIAILGTVKMHNYNCHVITPKTEHKSVLDIMRHIGTKGTKVKYLDVMKNGLIDVEKLSDSIENDTKLVSVMMANNEIGVIQPIEKIGAVCRDRGIVFHVDAAQAFGKIDIDVKRLNVDLLSVSGHKVYGPKGIGALYINSQRMNKKISAIHFGGGHEGGLRPGTLATHSIVGLGKSAEIAKIEKDSDAQLINGMRDILIDRVKNAFDAITVNGCMENRIPGNLNITFRGLNNEPFIQKLKSVSVSSGSACTSSDPEPSHVLKALGVEKSLIKSTIRIGIGKFNTEEEIIAASDYILEVANKLKR